jgi:hypothetical protein
MPKLKQSYMNVGRDVAEFRWASPSSSGGEVPIET